MNARPLLCADQVTGRSGQMRSKRRGSRDEGEVPHLWNQSCHRTSPLRGSNHCPHDRHHLPADASLAHNLPSVGPHAVRFRHRTPSRADPPLDAMQHVTKNTYGRRLARCPRHWALQRRATVIEPAPVSSYSCRHARQWLLIHLPSPHSTSRCLPLVAARSSLS